MRGKSGGASVTGSFDLLKKPEGEEREGGDLRLKIQRNVYQVLFQQTFEH